MKKKRFVIVFGAIIITILMISSATAVNIKLTDKIAYKNELKNEDIEIENNDEKDLVFNLIVKILNNEEIKKDLKNNLNVRIPKFYNFKSYDYNDIENLYQKGLKIYNSLSENQIKQRKEKIDKIIQKNYDSYESISNSISKNKEIMEDIEELSKNNNCDECDNSDINNWYPGKGLICITLVILAIAFSPLLLFLNFGIFLTVIAMLLGLPGTIPVYIGLLIAMPWYLTVALGDVQFFGCCELPPPPP